MLALHDLLSDNTSANTTNSSDLHQRLTGSLINDNPATQSSFYDHRKFLKTAETFGYFVIQPPICIIGIVFNLINLLVFRNRSFCAPAYTYMKSLAVAESFSLLLQIPQAVIKCDATILPTCENFSAKLRIAILYYLAYAHYPLTNILELVCILLTIALALERYNAIKQPNNGPLHHGYNHNRYRHHHQHNNNNNNTRNLKSSSYDNYNSRRRANQMMHSTGMKCVVFVIFSVVFSLPFFFVEHVENRNFSYQIRLTEFGKGKFYKYFLWFKIVYFLFIPFKFLLVLNILLLVMIRRAWPSTKYAKASEMSRSVSSNCNGNLEGTAAAAPNGTIGDNASSTANMHVNNAGDDDKIDECAVALKPSNHFQQQNSRKTRKNPQKQQIIVTDEHNSAAGKDEKKGSPVSNVVKRKSMSSGGGGLATLLVAIDNNNMLLSAKNSGKHYPPQSPPVMGLSASNLSASNKYLGVISAEHSGMAHSHSSGLNQYRDNLIHRSRIRFMKFQYYQRNLTILLVAIVFLFLIGNLPQAFTYKSVYEILTGCTVNDKWCRFVRDIYRMVSDSMRVIAYSSNFLLYLTLNRKFRHILRKRLLLIRHRTSLPKIVNYLNSDVVVAVDIDCQNTDSGECHPSLPHAQSTSTNKRCRWGDCLCGCMKRTQNSEEKQKHKIRKLKFTKHFISMSNIESYKSTSNQVPPCTNQQYHRQESSSNCDAHPLNDQSACGEAEQETSPPNYVLTMENKWCKESSFV